METKKILFIVAVIAALLITVGSALAVPTPTLEISDVKVGKTGETLVSYDNGNETTAFQPGDEITIKMKVKNNGNKIIHSIVVSIHADAALTNFPTTHNTPIQFYINPGQEKEVTYTYDIPANSVTGLYLVNFIVDGTEYQTNNLYADQQSFQLKIQQQYDNVFIDGTTYDQQLSCSDKENEQDVEVKLVNIGEEEPTYVTVELTNQAVLLDSENLPVHKESLNPGPQTVTLSYNPEGLVGQKQLTVKVYLTAIPEIVYDTETLTVSGENCALSLASFSPSQSSIVVDKHATQEFSVTVNNPQQLALGYQWSFDNNNLLGETTPVLEINFDQPQYTLGQHTVKVAFSGQGVNLPPKQWSVEIADHPAEFTISEIVFSDVELGAQDLTKQVTIKNIGSSGALTGVTVQLLNVNGNGPIDSDYHAQVTEGLPGTLTAGQQDTLTLQLDIPEDEDGGVIGKLKVTGTNANNTPVVKEATISVQPKNLLKISNVKVNNDDTGDLSLSEVNKITFDLKNEHTNDLKDIKVTVDLLDNEDKEVVTEDLDVEDDLNNGDTTDVEVELDLQNEDLDDNQYTLKITVEGEIEGNTHTVTFTQTVDVNRDDEEVAITKADLTNSKLYCVAKTTLRVTVKNNGDKDMKNLVLKVKNKDLNLDLSKSDIDLKDYSSSDHDYEATFEIDVTDVAAGTYTLEVELQDDDSDTLDSEEVELEVKDCLGQSTAGTGKEFYADKELADELQKKLNEYTSAKDGAQVTEVSFRDSEQYTMLLGVLVVLLGVASVLSMVLLLTKRK